MDSRRESYRLFREWQCIAGKFELFGNRIKWDYIIPAEIPPSQEAKDLYFSERFKDLMTDCISVEGRSRVFNENRWKAAQAVVRRRHGV